MNAPRAAPSGIDFPNRTTTRIAKTAAAIAARLTALRQVGGLSSRSCLRWREICLASACVGDRPVLPARSIVPAGVPRCLRVRLRLVCAIPATLPDGLGDRAEHFLEDVALGVEPAQGHVIGEALERGAGRQADQLGLGHVGAVADVFDDLA